MSIESILVQCPEDTTKEDVEELWNKYDGNVSDILSDVWKVSTVNNGRYSEQKKKWDDIRDICNTYEHQMEEHMKALRKQ